MNGLTCSRGAIASVLALGPLRPRSLELAQEKLFLRDGFLRGALHHSLRQNGVINSELSPYRFPTQSEFLPLFKIMFAGLYCPGSCFFFDWLLIEAADVAL